jgi:hypothetical protein
VFFTMILTDISEPLAPMIRIDLDLPDGTSYNKIAEFKPKEYIASGPAFADYLDLARGQIRRYGCAEPAVCLALLAAGRRRHRRHRPAPANRDRRPDPPGPRLLGNPDRAGSRPAPRARPRRTRPRRDPGTLMSARRRDNRVKISSRCDPAG